MSKVAEAMEYYEIYLDKMPNDKAIKLLTDAGFVIVEYCPDAPTTYGLITLYGIQDPADVFTDIRKCPTNMDEDGPDDPFYKPFIYVW